MEFRWNIGQFFLYLSLVLLVIFFITDQQYYPEYAFLCSGVILLVIGVSLMWSNRAKPETSQRFRMLRSTGKKEDKKPSARSKNRDIEREKEKEMK